MTSFFRNPEAFDVLQREVLPELFNQAGDDPLRAWVLGCSTGQEAYSLAIAFAETAEKAPRLRKLQVFATDLNEALLDKARHGLYAKSLAEDITPERLRRFFVEEEGGYRVSKALREMVVFARQNLINDPPFSRMDLISCRNLLIYLEPSLQKKAIPVFHYALKPGRFLLLGASESIGGFTELFEPVDKKHKIYVKKAAAIPAFQLPIRKERDERRPLLLPLSMGRGAEPAEGLRGELSAQREADRIVVNRFAPPGVLVNDQLQVLQFRGPTGAYLEPPSGKASFDVLKMAREGLMLPLRAAINQAKKENQAARKDNVRVKRNGETRAVNVEVIPLKNLRERCLLILFEDADGRRRPPDLQPAPAARVPRDEAAKRIGELEADLAETRDYLQSMQEQHEAANEELQAANEEVQSANEELQSINEELETSKEELESSNEELATVNEEMGNRNTELNRLNDDLVNLQTSAKLAIVLLGRDLAIRRFSAQAEKQFDLLATDVGRPIGHIRHNLVLDSVAGEAATSDLERLIAEVIANVREETREVRDKAGRWYSLRLRPYMTQENKIDGAALVLVDIDALKRSEQALAEARDYAENVIETVREPLLVLDPELRVERANRAFYRTFRTASAETVGELFYELGNRQWDIPRLRELLEEVLPLSSSIEDFEVEHDFEPPDQRTLLLNARCILDLRRKTRRILLALEDVTERKGVEKALRESERRFREMADALPAAIYTTDAQGLLTYFNPIAVQAAGRTPQLGKDQWCVTSKLFRPDGTPLPHDQCPIAIMLKGGREIRGEQLIAERPDGTHLWGEVYPTLLRDDEGRITGGIVMIVDITERKRMELKIAKQAKQLVNMNRRKDEFLAMLSHELRNPMAPMFNALQLIEQEGGENALQREARGVIEHQVRHMSRMVDDLLEISRITTGRIHLHSERVDLNAVIERAVERARPTINRRKQQLSLSPAPDTVWLNADTTRLEQVVGNLLDNASKYNSDGGRITLSVERGDGEAIIRVRDDGEGIAADTLPHIFDLFTQSDRSLDRSQGGLGIGLALVQSLTEMHRGAVEVHSEGIGRGSEFVVRLPVASETQMQPVDAAAPPDIATEGDSRLRILVVDDNVDAAKMAALLLRSWGYGVRVAHDGPGALQRATGFRPQVILLDIGLPDMDGFEVARLVRHDPQLKDVRIIAVTGYGQDTDRQRSKEAGCDHHLVKPVEPSDLKALLAGFHPPPI